MITREQFRANARNATNWGVDKVVNVRLDAIAWFFMNPGTGVRLGASAGCVVESVVRRWAVRWGHHFERFELFFLKDILFQF